VVPELRVLAPLYVRLPRKPVLALLVDRGADGGLGVMRAEYGLRRAAPPRDEGVPQSRGENHPLRAENGAEVVPLCRADDFPDAPSETSSSISRRRLSRLSCNAAIWRPPSSRRRRLTRAPKLSESGRS